MTAQLTPTPGASAEAPSEAAATLARLRAHFATGVTRDAGWRIRQLEALKRLLTEREKDIVRRLAHGHSNAALAHELGLSEATVKTHVTRLLTKLGVSSRVQAVVLAYESGLVRVGEPR